MTKWEYLVVSAAGHSDAEIERDLDSLGLYGWECFAATSDGRFYLKRPLPRRTPKAN